MRKYQPIWEAIKKNNTASLVAPSERHTRIIKAVKKEKNLDEGYKLIISDKGLRATLVITTHPVNKDLLSFTLDITMKLSCTGVNNL